MVMIRTFRNCPSNSTTTSSFRIFSVALFLETIFIFSSILPSSSSSLSHTEQTNSLVSCLNSHNINNFTLYPQPGSDSSINYYKLLNFSIQNLRFVETSFSKPIAIILPQTKQQLASSVVCSRNGSLEMRIRCGGHSYEGTSSVVADGVPFVIIDLMNLDSVEVDLEAGFAWVEGGATLGQTYHAIAQSSNVHGFSAGSCPTVGVGGHIAGGGFGLLSRKYGLAADNVVDAVLIDADGKLLDRESMGEDVFWAIRGGGGGVWGIIYAWKIKLLKVPETVTCFIVSRHGNNTKHAVSDLVHKWQFVAPELDDEFYLSAFVGAGLPQTKTTGISATFKGFYLGPKAEATTILTKRFPELGIAEEDCEEMSWIDSVVFFSGLEGDAPDLTNRYLSEKGYFKAKSDYVRTPIPLSGVKDALRKLEEETKGYVILDPNGGAMKRISKESIAFPHREGNIFSIQYLVEWKEEDMVMKNEMNYMAWIRGFYRTMEPYVSSGPRAAYINYMDLDLGQFDRLKITTSAGASSSSVEVARVWGEKYFLRNYDRLVRAKTLVDPQNIFRHEQGIPPLESSKEHSQRRRELNKIN